MEQNVEHRSGMLVGREPVKPAKVTVLSNENPHPCVGVMYPAFLNDVEPATGRDLPPDGLTLEETESMVVLRTNGVITPGTMPIPKEGTVGYVKVENPNDYVRETEPRWFDVDDFNDMSDEELADLGKLRDDAGRIHDALYLDDAGRPARDAKGRLLDAMPSIGGYVYIMEEPAEDYQVETVNVGFEPKQPDGSGGVVFTFKA